MLINVALSYESSHLCAMACSIVNAQSIYQKEN